MNNSYCFCMERDIGLICIQFGNLHGDGKKEEMSGDWCGNLCHEDWGRRVVCCVVSQCQVGVDDVKTSGYLGK